MQSHIKLNSVAIALTERCNLQCHHCGSIVEEFSNLIGQSELSRATLQKIFTEVKKLGAETIILSGGEPLLYKDLVAVLNDLHRCDLSCGLFTNGTLLTKAVLKTLTATGALSFLRFSVEYSQGDTVKPTQNCRITSEVFERITMANSFGIPSGVNMVLLPDNLNYALQLAEEAKNAGAHFFRVVPLLPAGRGKGIVLSPTFFAECMEVAFSLQQKYGPKSTGTFSVSKGMFHNAGNAFVTSCGGGSKTISISADGRAHICPMIDLGNAVNVTDTPIKECLKILKRRRAYLQKKIMAQKGSACRKCIVVDRCRGGCLAEWMARGETGGQPNCYRRNWRLAAKKFPFDKKMGDVVSSLINTYDLIKTFNGPVPCYRSLPFWSVHFKSDA